MGLRGPAPKPTAMKRANGNPGHQVLGNDDLRVEEGEPEMPAGMSVAAQKIWKAIVPLLLNTPGLLSVLDGSGLADFCDVRARKMGVQRAMDSASKRAFRQWQILGQVRKAMRGKSAAEQQEIFAEMQRNWSEHDRDVMITMADDIRNNAVERAKLLMLSRQEVEARAMDPKLMDQYIRLLHRENVLRRELGLSPSARSSIRISGKQESADQPEEEILFGRRRNLMLGEESGGLIPV